MSLASGKVSARVLTARVFSYLGCRREDVVLRAAIGEDAAAVAADGSDIILSSDPITGADEDGGWYAVHIAVNDVAATGAEPIAILLTILLPEQSSEHTVEKLMRQADRAAREVGIEIIGGHTEVTAAVNQVIVCGTAVGRVSAGKLITSSGARPGDDLIMTKTAGLEGTAIAACDFEEVVSSLIGVDKCQRAQAMKRLLSIVPEARTAASCGATAMHDATEGGILGAVFELVTASQAGVIVDQRLIQIAPETDLLCRALHVDPLRLVSSGVLLITAADGNSVVKELESAGIQAAVIGSIQDEKQGMVLIGSGRQSPIVPPEGDELWRLRDQLSHTD